MQVRGRKSTDYLTQVAKGRIEAHVAWGMLQEIARKHFLSTLQPPRTSTEPAESIDHTKLMAFLEVVVRLGPDGRRSPQTLETASGPMPTRSIEDGNLYGGNPLLGAIEMLGAASVLVHRKMLAGSVLVAPPGFSSLSTTGFGALPETTANSTGQGFVNTSGYDPRREAPPIYGGTGNDYSMEDSEIHVEKYTPDNKIKKKNKMKKKSDILSPILSLDNTVANKPTRSHGASALSDKTPISSEEISVVAQPHSEPPLEANVSETFDGVNNTDTQIKNKPVFPVVSILKKTAKKKMESQNLKLDNTILNKPIKSQKTSPSIRHKTVNSGEQNPIVAKPEVQMKDDANIAQTLDDVTEIQNTLKIPGDNEFSKDIGTSDKTKSLDIGKSEYQEGTKTVEDPAINSRCTKMTICADIPRRSCISGTNGLFVMAEVSQSPTTSKTTGTFIVSGEHTLNRQSEYCSNRGINNVCPTTKISKVTQPKESFYTSKSKTSRIPGERRDTESSKSIIMPNSLEIEGDETLDTSQNRRENASSIISDDTREEQETSEASAKDKLSKAIQNLEKAETQSGCGSTGLTVIIRGSGNARVSVTSECSEIPNNLRAKDAFGRASTAGMPSLSEESASVRSRRNDEFCKRNRCSMIPELPEKPTECKIHELNEMPISVCSQADSTLNNIKLPDVSRINEIKGYTDENNILSMSEALGLSRDDKRCSSIGVTRTSQMKKGNGKRTTMDARISEEQIEKSAPLFETMKTVCETERIRSHGLELKAERRESTGDEETTISFLWLPAKSSVNCEEISTFTLGNISS
ncbi:Protein of unknown function [Gryllus bimaculatus]|nr:Protein of unknown function [Gryllus bimaculatus]